MSEIKPLELQEIADAALFPWNKTLPPVDREIEVPRTYGYTRAFWQDGYWWYYDHLTAKDCFSFGGFAAGPTPSLWKEINATNSN